MIGSYHLINIFRSMKSYIMSRMKIFSAFQRVGLQIRNNSCICGNH